MKSKNLIISFLGSVLISALLTVVSCNVDDIKLPSTSNNLVAISGKNTANVKIGQTDTFSIDLKNDGNTELIINDVDFSQNDDNAFSFENGKPIFLVKILPNKKYSIKLRFTPTEVKTYTAILAVTGNSPADTKTYTLKFKGEVTSGSIKVQPTIGVFTGCDYHKAIRDLTDFDNNAHTDYITNHYKLQVKAIDSINGLITFVVKRCDNLNFQFNGSIYIYETNPVFWGNNRFFSTNDPDATIDFQTKFEGHDIKRYIATITESGSNGKYYCTKEITLEW